MAEPMTRPTLRALIGIVAALFVTACVNTPEFLGGKHAAIDLPSHHEDSVTPSELSKSPETFEGRQVSVRGWLDVGPERYKLFESDNTEEGGANLPCVTVGLSSKSWSEALNSNHQMVVVTGVFRSDLVGDRIFLGMCNPAGVEAASVQRIEK